MTRTTHNEIQRQQEQAAHQAQAAADWEALKAKYPPQPLPPAQPRRTEPTHDDGSIDADFETSCGGGDRGCGENPCVCRPLYPW